MREFVLYSLARLGLLAVTLVVVVWALGPSVFSLVAAVLIAAMLSYLLLAGLRRRATDAMAKRRRLAKASAASTPGAQPADARPADARQVDAQQADARREGERTVDDQLRAAATGPRRRGADESAEDEALDAAQPVEPADAAEPDTAEAPPASDHRAEP